MALLQDFFHLFFPHLCEACSSALYEGEEGVCLRCRSKLPATDYAEVADNLVARLFWGRVKLEKAAAVYFYHKGNRIQVLLHALKYKGRKELGVLLGKWMYASMNRNHWLDDVDYLMPVPLHPKKLKKRGYNQALMLAIGFSAESAIPLKKEVLIRGENRGSQTRLSRVARWENAKDAYSVKMEDDIRGKHILLIDDVVTTGATLESCANVLMKEGACRVSVLAVACAFQ
ncbi:MAG: ComF family protein [Bacteroidetes bacterium]|nr:ComF family protein [Bacteroidota bacterium]